jgi:hypothetical protein
VEQASFAAQGVVKTTDGKEIAFSYELEMERQFHSETHESVRAGDALLKDPLVINFGGTAAQLTDRKFAFDLDADGTKDQIAWVQPGSGFLALDKNGNGAIARLGAARGEVRQRVRGACGVRRRQERLDRRGGRRLRQAPGVVEIWHDG